MYIYVWVGLFVEYVHIKPNSASDRLSVGVDIITLITPITLVIKEQLINICDMCFMCLCGWGVCGLCGWYIGLSQGR